MISSEIEKLIKLHGEFDRALNKFEVRQDIMILIKSIEAKINNNNSVLEDYWLTLSKKATAFEDFDLNHKVQKRQLSQNEG